VSRLAFPDILGVSSLTANASVGVSVRKGALNIVSLGVTATDNPGRRRTDVTIPDKTLACVTGSRSSSGEWQPAIVGTEGADLVRVSSSTTGTILTGLDFSGTQIKLAKFVANVGTNTIEMQPPASPVGGHAYFANSFTLRQSETARVVWDESSLVYRIAASTAVPAADLITVDGSYITVDGNHVLSP
jgi:hypothetical protein